MNQEKNEIKELKVCLKIVEKQLRETDRKYADAIRALEMLAEGLDTVIKASKEVRKVLALHKAQFE